MSFVRTKEIPPRSGNWYDYEVESYREDGQVKQRIIQYIGKSGTIKNLFATYRSPVMPNRYIIAPKRTRGLVCEKLMLTRYWHGSPYYYFLLIIHGVFLVGRGLG